MAARILLALLATVLCAAASAATGEASTPTDRVAHLPDRGVVVPDSSIGGVSLGMTEAQVRARWGTGYVVCSSCGAVPTWLYEYSAGDPIGAGVRWSPQGRVIAVFTIGSPDGWGFKGVMIGDPIGNVYTLFANARSANCIGYSALTVTSAGETTAFYSSSGLVYGYALTRSSLPACQ